jgi:hypothetical protein
VSDNGQLEAVRGIGSALAAMEKAKQMLDVARTIPEVADIRDKLSAIRELLKRCRASRGIQNTAAELKLRSERRMGELLKDVSKGRPSNNPHDAVFLKDVGISTQDSSRLQRIAGIPADEFDAYISTAVEEGLELTTSGVVRLWHALNPSSPKPFQPESEFQAIKDWLSSRRESWPAEYRHTFTGFVARVLEQLEEPDADDGGGGAGAAEAGRGAP